MLNPKAHRQPQPILDLPKGAPAMRDTVSLQDKIRERAYQLYESRGRQPGRDQEDWLGLSSKSSTMDKQTWECPQCRELDRVFRFKLTKYVESCSSAFYRVTKEFAAKNQVDMERAKNDMEEHLLICTHAAKVKRLDQVRLNTVANILEH